MKKDNSESSSKQDARDGYNGRKGGGNGKGKDSGSAPAGGFTVKDENKFGAGKWTAPITDQVAGIEQPFIKNPQLLDDSSRISFSNPAGLPLDWDAYGETWEQVSGAGSVIPGICVAEIDMIPGLSENALSPINLAALEQFVFIRSRITKRLPYQRQDIILTEAAVDSFFYTWNFAARAYRLVSDVNVFNRYKPQALIEAMRIDYNDLVANAADFRYALNVLVDNAQNLCVPANIEYFRRHSALMSNVYCDSTNVKAQIYLFRPHSYYVYNETSSSTGSFLQYRNFYGSGKLKTADIINILQTQLNAILSSSSIGNISGDIAYSFGSSLTKLTYLGEFDTQAYVFDEKLLSQFHNLNVIPASTTISSDDLATWNITQNPSTETVVFNPVVGRLDPGAAPSYVDRVTPDFVRGSYPQMINSKWDSPQPVDNMVMTRFKTMTYRVTGEDDDIYYIATCGTELVRDLDIIYLNYSSNNTPTIISQSVPLTMIYGTNAAECASLARLAAMTTNFDWFPLIYVALGTSNMPGSYNLTSIQGDLANYTLIGLADLRKMNLAAILSEFNVPE